MVALVGRSGCGKSTCLRLLSRMYEPNFGQILLDGRSIQDYESGFFHQQVVHVSSEVELLNRSIKENVQYGIMGASEIGKAQRKKTLVVPTFVTKVTEYLCSGWVFFSSDKFRHFN